MSCQIEHEYAYKITYGILMLKRIAFHAALKHTHTHYKTAFLMTDSICHSSLPRTVLEKVTLTTFKFRIYPRTKVDPVFYCVYISTPLKS